MPVADTGSQLSCGGQLRQEAATTALIGVVLLQQELQMSLSLGMWRFEHHS